MREPIEVTLLLEEHPCEVMNTFQKLGIKARIENVKLREEVTDHIAELKADDVVLAELKRSSLKVLRMNNEKVWIRTKGCAVCRLLYHNDVIVEKVKVVGDRKVIYKIMLPGIPSLKAFLGELNRVGVKATVLEISEVGSEKLTERQMEILKLAYKLGYFDVDRGISLKELAEKLGVSPPSLEEVLRRALKKAVKYYLEKKG
ncbi:MAG: hypothetical protein ASUL_08644 [Candidatus Aramenus sulfurataquae]|uniref:HTH bat-type domain-containing protein n=1 Tax=Candidatus Aramenus sulfurataquae TaxID=1326980 RepID=W7KK82_9CREN|nr:MAG: hypothetical protein ASUL_08644 [Candidatus Aramenus sulfurataquae]